MISKQDALTWAEALESGIYKQAPAVLQASPDSYCCLGVACVVFIPKEQQERVPYTGLLSKNIPEGQPGAPQWLKDINNDLGKRTGRAFTILNDYFVYTFTQIAQVIRLVYVQRAKGLKLLQGLASIDAMEF